MCLVFGDYISEMKSIRKSNQIKTDSTKKDENVSFSEMDTCRYPGHFANNNYTPREMCLFPEIYFIHCNIRCCTVYTMMY